ncbi:MAG TPA: hypothetical protein VNA20_07595 [Frankiaceae bacterium]|nr:hypothetical protein [Frankiaceae bacterium]
MLALLVLAAVCGGASLVLAMLGACHDTGGFCTDGFSGENVAAYAASVVAAGCSGAALGGAVLPRRNFVLLVAAIGAAVALLGVSSIEG